MKQHSEDRSLTRPPRRLPRWVIVLFIVLLPFCLFLLDTFAPPPHQHPPLPRDWQPAPTRIEADWHHLVEDGKWVSGFDYGIPYGDGWLVEQRHRATIGGDSVFGQSRLAYLGASGEVLAATDPMEYEAWLLVGEKVWALNDFGGNNDPAPTNLELLAYDAATLTLLDRMEVPDGFPTADDPPSDSWFGYLRPEDDATFHLICTRFPDRPDRESVGARRWLIDGESGAVLSRTVVESPVPDLGQSVSGSLPLDPDLTLNYYYGIHRHRTYDLRTGAETAGASPPTGPPSIPQSALSAIAGPVQRALGGQEIGWSHYCPAPRVGLGLRLVDFRKGAMLPTTPGEKYDQLQDMLAMQFLDSAAYRRWAGERTIVGPAVLVDYEVDPVDARMLEGDLASVAERRIRAGLDGGVRLDSLDGSVALVTQQFLPTSEMREFTGGGVRFGTVGPHDSAIAWHAWLALPPESPGPGRRDNSLEIHAERSTWVIQLTTEVTNQSGGSVQEEYWTPIPRPEGIPAAPKGWLRRF